MCSSDLVPIKLVSFRPEVRTRTVEVTEYVQQPVSREVQYTVGRPEVRERTVMVPRQRLEPRSRQVAYTVFKPVVQTRTVPVTDMVPQERTREVPYVEYISVPRTGVRTVTTYKCVPQTITQSYTVQVPYTVEKEIRVPVCRPKQACPTDASTAAKPKV